MSLVVLVLVIATANFAIGFGLAVYAGHGPAANLLDLCPKFWQRDVAPSAEASP